MSSGASTPTSPYGRRRSRRERYRVRLLACLAASLGIAIAAVRLWPSILPEENAGAIVYAGEPVDLREVTQTQHTRRAAPPPPPPPVPLYETQEDIEFDPLDLTLELAPAEDPTEAPLGPESLQDGGEDVSSTPAPDVGARQLRIAEPKYTRAARREGIRARVDVEVIIAPTGRVTDAQVVRRTVLATDDAPARTVTTLGYGLEDAALEAARSTLFRPARVGDRAVESRKTLTLTFGPGE